MSFIRQGPRARSRGRPRAAARQTYHHGELRTALLAAAERELAENGIEGFTLRGCARRAGVSHAAPAHHFPDVRALLTEMATIGFERLSESMAVHARNTQAGSADHILAIGKGYVAFAVENPHLFRLIFRTGLLDVEDLRYKAAGAAAFSIPVHAIGALGASDDPMADPELASRVIAIWSIVHGFSELVLAGQLDRARGPGRMVSIDELLARVIGEGLLPLPQGRERRRLGKQSGRVRSSNPDHAASGSS